MEFLILHWVDKRLHQRYISCSVLIYYSYEKTNFIHHHWNPICFNHGDAGPFCIWMVRQQSHCGLFFPGERILLGAYEIMLFPHAGVFLFYARQIKNWLPLRQFRSVGRHSAWYLSDPGHLLYLLRNLRAKLSGAGHRNLCRQCHSILLGRLPAESVLPPCPIYPAVKRTGRRTCHLFFCLHRQSPYHRFVSTANLIRLVFRFSRNSTHELLPCGINLFRMIW